MAPAMLPIKIKTFGNRPHQRETAGWVSRRAQPIPRATSTAIDALAPIVGPKARQPPGIDRAKAALIRKACAVRMIPANDIPGPFARGRSFVPGVVLGCHRCIGHRRYNKSRPKQANNNLAHRLSPSFVVMH
jgi:hypothetical protein